MVQPPSGLRAISITFTPPASLGVTNIEILSELLVKIMED